MWFVSDTTAEGDLLSHSRLKLHEAKPNRNNGDVFARDTFKKFILAVTALLKRSLLVNESNK